MKWIVKIILNGFALLIADQFIQGFEIEGIKSAIIAALILGIVNAIIKPILIFLTLPITILSLGLFILVINGITFMITANFVDGFTVFSYQGAFWGALITSLFSWILNGLAHDK